MFKIKNSENITLDGNKTDGEVMAELDNVKDFTARNNEIKKADKDIVSLKPGLYGISIDLKVLWKKLFK